MHKLSEVQARIVHRLLRERDRVLLEIEQELKEVLSGIILQAELNPEATYQIRQDADGALFLEEVVAAEEDAGGKDAPASEAEEQQRNGDS